MTWNCTNYMLCNTHAFPPGNKEGKCMTKLFLISIISYWWLCSAVGSVREISRHCGKLRWIWTPGSWVASTGSSPNGYFWRQSSSPKYASAKCFADLVSRGKRAIVSNMLRKFSFKRIIWGRDLSQLKKNVFIHTLLIWGTNCLGILWQRTPIYCRVNGQNRTKSFPFIIISNIVNCVLANAYLKISKHLQCNQSYTILRPLKSMGTKGC